VTTAQETAEETRSAALRLPTGEPPLATSISAERPPFDPLLTIDQVSDWLGVPKGTLYQWRSRSQGPLAIKVGGGLRYRRSEVDGYLDLHTDARPA